MADVFIYIARVSQSLPAQNGKPILASLPQSHMRWHVLRNEWVIYSTHRQSRTFLPGANGCPLCPPRSPTQESEIPFENFEIAVFENRFPAMNAAAQDEFQSVAETKAARGVCEVVVFSPEHEGSLASIGQDKRELLVQVWIDRYKELYQNEFVSFVLPFENRGVEVGVTLTHPHGQLYAYPFVPPILEKECTAFKKEAVLLKLLDSVSSEFTVWEDENMRALVPPCARYPYEVWVIPKIFHPGPWTFSNNETKSFARALGECVRGYDSLFGKPFPYNMVLHAAPKGFEDCFHFHAEFYPPLRTAEKLKYVAAAELGAGNFLVDALPEVTAPLLRQALEASHSH